MAELGILEVHLVAGKGMKNSELLFGKNDPYAIISYKTQDQKSKTLEGAGSDPRWNQSFFFIVDDETAEVVIKFFDEDKRSADDNIGSTNIPLSKVLSELVVPAYFYDIVQPSGNKHGQVEVALKFSPKAPAERPRPPQNGVHHPCGVHPHHNSNGPYGDDNEGGWK